MKRLPLTPFGYPDDMDISDCLGHGRTADEELRLLRIMEILSSNRDMWKGGCVYLITDGETYKIGKTGNPRERFKALQKQNEKTLRFVLIRRLLRYHHAEEYLLNHFAAKQIEGRREWFNLDTEDITEMEKILDDFEFS